jgi:hypothetical protein
LDKKNWHPQINFRIDQVHYIYILNYATVGLMYSDYGKKLDNTFVTFSKTWQAFCG